MRSEIAVEIVVIAVVVIGIAVMAISGHEVDVAGGGIMRLAARDEIVPTMRLAMT